MSRSWSTRSLTFSDLSVEIERMRHTLYLSLRSPFARRIRLALEELGVPYDVETVDVFNLPPAYDAINPLRRVPVLKTPEGTLIIDRRDFGITDDRLMQGVLFVGYTVNIGITAEATSPLPYVK